MSLPIDRRIMRTKAEIRQALVELIEEKGFEALSVKDIATKANINRGTFYLHYKDKFDLLDQTVEDVIQEILGILLEIANLPTIGLGNIQIPKGIITRVFQYFDANASLMQAILATKGRYALQNEMKKLVIRNLFENNKVSFIQKEKLQVPLEYLASYIASAHFGVIQEWLDRGRQETPEEMAETLIRLTFRGPLFAAGLFS